MLDKVQVVEQEFKDRWKSSGPTQTINCEEVSGNEDSFRFLLGLLGDRNHVAD